jgi:hypothetical protein
MAKNLLEIHSIVGEEVGSPPGRGTGPLRRSSQRLGRRSISQPWINEIGELNSGLARRYDPFYQLPINEILLRGRSPEGNVTHELRCGVGIVRRD